MEKNEKEQQQRRMEWMMMEMQLHMEKNEKDKAIKSHYNVLKNNLPKFVITMFNGTHIDWVRFWSKFKGKIDIFELSAFSKFSYLPALISSKIRVLIDGMHFAGESFIRVKSILAIMYR